MSMRMYTDAQRPSQFTVRKVEDIRRLVQLKVRAKPEEQKRLRDRGKEFGFLYLSLHAAPVVGVRADRPRPARRIGTCYGYRLMDMAIAVASASRTTIRIVSDKMIRARTNPHCNSANRGGFSETQV